MFLLICTRSSLVVIEFFMIAVTQNENTQNAARQQQQQQQQQQRIAQPQPQATTRPQQPELLFHTKCGEHAAVINGGRAAHRPNAIDDFNHGVVLTNRHLQPNEMFEVNRYTLFM